MAARGFKTWCESVAVEIRRRLGLKAIDPLHSEQLASDLGVTLCTPRDIPGLSVSSVNLLLGQEKDSWSAVTLSINNLDLVIYNSAHSPGRQSNDIMHELSHILLGHDPAKLMLSPHSNIALRSYKDDHEEEATWLAGCLLLPRPALVHIKTSRLDTGTAAHQYQVTPKLLGFRMNITGLNRQFS